MQRVALGGGQRGERARDAGVGVDVLAALAAATPPPDAVLVTLADQPLVDAAALRGLLHAFAGGHRLVAAAYAGTVGVPAVFGREHLGGLADACGGDRGAASWLRRQGDAVFRVPLAVAAADVDTEEDLRRLVSSE